MRAGMTVAIAAAIGIVASFPRVIDAQPKIEFKSRELQEGRNYLQRLIGSVGVTGSGGRLSFRFPLVAPPGRGISPDLALVYSSSAGYSEYGHGRELTLPTIERDPSDRAPHYDDTDHFRYKAGFDTRRLVATGEVTADGWTVFGEETEQTFSRYL